VSDSPYIWRRRTTNNPVTKRLVGYGIVGLVIAVALIAGLQVRPQNLFPSNGILQISIQSDPLTVSCQGMHGENITLTSLVVNITSVTVHRTGALNLTGEWIPLNDTPRTLDLFQLKNVTQLSSTSLPEGTINIVRIDVASATASSNGEPVNLVVSSDHLQAQPSAQVTGGMITSIVVMPHVVCEGNGTFRLTPDLTAMSTTPRD
jgi:uncharacterized protein DUF4382